MSKRIGCVEEMVNKALRGVEAHITRRGIYVYEAKWLDNKLIVKHYGTTILEYDIEENEILNYDGYSNSDRDALNTVLHYCVTYIGAEYFYIRDRSLRLGKQGVHLV